MLTWAIAYLFVRTDFDNGLHLVVAMGCDVAIFYHISKMFGHCG